MYNGVYCAREEREGYCTGSTLSLLFLSIIMFPFFSNSFFFSFEKDETILIYRVSLIFSYPHFCVRLCLLLCWGWVRGGVLKIVNTIYTILFTSNLYSTSTNR